MATDDDMGSAPTAAPPLLADRYEILGLLGAGGMGRVYRAHDRTLDEIVALKVLRRDLVDIPGALDRFRREVKLARRVTHAHVVRTFDLGQHGDEHFLTMEYVEGRSLAQRLDDGPLAIDEVMRIARAVCAGIAAAHAAGVLHRDLKPDNVLVATSGRIALTDFGIARAAASPAVTAEQFVGTPAYMAPEQVSGQAELGPPVDVYAFGAILFEMLTGRRPFEGSDPFAVALARLHQPPPDPRAFRAIPDALAEVVLRCLAREPGGRHADASALASALAALDPMPDAGTLIRPAVPGKVAPAIAVLPLRAPADLAEVADGLSEEIVDALSLTRALRVRPLAAVRRLRELDGDPRAVGAALGVDVVVDGAIRRRGDALRVTARATGVADGFQLWASHVDTGPSGLLAAGDEVARAVARALTVELVTPDRAAGDTRATALYLEGKARLRANWHVGRLEHAIEVLDQAAALAPDDARVLASLATALARSQFLDAGKRRARPVAERAVAIDPTDGEAWLALALAFTYEGAPHEAGPALIRAVSRAPGLAIAQSLLGALLLEAGALDDAIAHLEGAHALDPESLRTFDLPRAYIYAGRDDDAHRLLDSIAPPRVIAEMHQARFASWRGRTYEVPALDLEVPAEFIAYADVVRRISRTRRFEREDREEMTRLTEASTPRMRVARFQFMAEFLCFSGDLDAALDAVRRSVESGLLDHLWFERCPALAPLRERPAFQAQAAVVAARARKILDAVDAARAG